MGPGGPTCTIYVLVYLILVWMSTFALSIPLYVLSPCSAGHEPCQRIEEEDYRKLNITDGIRARDTFHRGVNIGGWLILEKWMNPDVFSGTEATDQWTFDSTPDALSRLTSHWNTWFTESDVQWLRGVGVNA